MKQPYPPWDDSPRCTDLTRTRGYRETYSYDEMGNIAQLSHGHRLADGTIQIRNRNFIPFIDSEFVPTNNRLETVSIGSLDYAYLYDSNGNMVQENTSRHFEWNHSDRMKVFRTQSGSAEPSVHAHYLYDANGQRVKKLLRRQSGQINVTVYVDEMLEYHRQVQGTTVRENNTLHVMDDQQRIALVRVGTAFSEDRSPAVRYSLGDHLGSSNVVLGNNGSLVNREEFTPYGETSFGSFAKKRYRFTGKERDEESGLNYHGARYYATHTGRWLSIDPISSEFTSSYTGFGNNPLTFTDPSGLQPRPPIRRPRRGFSSRPWWRPNPLRNPSRWERHFEARMRLRLEFVEEILNAHRIETARHRLSQMLGVTLPVAPTLPPRVVPRVPLNPVQNYELLQLEAASIRAGNFRLTEPRLLRSRANGTGNGGGGSSSSSGGGGRGGLPRRLVVGRVPGGNGVPDIRLNDPNYRTETMDRRSTGRGTHGHYANSLENAPTSLNGVFARIEIERIGVPSASGGISIGGLSRRGIQSAHRLLEPGGTLRIIQQVDPHLSRQETEARIRNVIPGNQFNITEVSYPVINGVEHVDITLTRR